MTRFNFNIRSLLAITFVMAAIVAAFLPLKPNVSFSTAIAVPAHPSYSDRCRQFRISMTNNGIMPIWCRGTELPIKDFSWGAEVGEAHIDIYKDESSTLASGATRTYDIVVHRDYSSCRLFVDIRDWRNRETTVFAGEFNCTDVSAK